MAKNRLRSAIKQAMGRVAPHIGLFGHDIFADLAKRKAGFEPDVIFDVGANIGTNSVEYARKFEGAAIYAFEPSEENYGQLLANTKGLPVSCIRAGLGKANETLKFLHDENNPTMSRIVDEGPFTQQIEVLRLDDFVEESNVERISYLKIDTEGHDLDVLMGASGALERRMIDFVEVECGLSPSNNYHVPLTEVMEFLTPRGYAVFGFYEQAMEWTIKRPFLRRCNTVFMNMHLGGKPPGPSA